MLTSTRCRRIPAALMASVAAIITTFTLGACGSDSNSKSPTEMELERRGFSEITEQVVPEKGSQKYYYVSYGKCRIRVDEKSPEEGGGLKATEISSRGDEGNLNIDEPSVAKLDQIGALDYCAPMDRLTGSPAPN